MDYSVQGAGRHNQSLAMIKTFMAEETLKILCPICHKETLYRAKVRYCQHCGQDVVLNNDCPTDELRYYINRIIKQGGQGAVYAGMDIEGHTYAIKEMLDRFLNPKERIEAINRFNEEARLLQSLSHQRIPRIYSHFTDGGRHYLTMDFVHGEDLDQILQREGSLPEDKVLIWADQICDVLHYLHQNDLIYRDMKPSNVMIEYRTNSVKLVDFGITKLFKPTERGTQIGTPGYAPPEQYQGFATPASDVYALAATLHHLLTGRDPTEEAPFSFPPARNINIHISRRTSDALQKALKMQPEERFGSITEFRTMLRPLPATPPPPPVPTHIRRASQQTHVAHAQVAAPKSLQAGPQPHQATILPAPSTPSVQRPSLQTPAKQVTPSQTARTKKQSRSGWVGWCILWLILLSGAAGMVWHFAPDLVHTYLPELPSIQLPQTHPTTTVSIHQETLEITVWLPSDADTATIMATLRNEYDNQIKAKFGAKTLINTNTLSFVGGGWQKIDNQNGQIRYQAKIQGFIQTP